MSEVQSIPWLMAVLSAVVFAVIAFRARRAWPAWAIGWGLYGLVLSAWVTGVFMAAHLPVNTSESALTFKTFLVNGLLILIPAALCFWKLAPEKEPPRPEGQTLGK
jgi:hypothetical protein